MVVSTSEGKMENEDVHNEMLVELLVEQPSSLIQCISNGEF